MRRAGRGGGAAAGRGVRGRGKVSVDQVGRGRGGGWRSCEVSSQARGGIGDNVWRGSHWSLGCARAPRIRESGNQGIREAEAPRKCPIHRP